jgi:hypothetical protein
MFQVISTYDKGFTAQSDIYIILKFYEQKCIQKLKAIYTC